MPSEKSRVVVVLPDGERRAVELTEEEIERLVEGGADVSSWRVRVLNTLAGPAGWILGILLTALLIPAVTNQWADRPRAQDIRGSLVRDLSEASAAAISDARFLGATALPEAALVDKVCPDNASAEDRAHCAEARRAEVVATARVNRTTLTNWRGANAAADARVATYLPSQLAGVRDYGDAMEHFLALFTDACDVIAYRNRLTLVGYLDGITYTPSNLPAKWRPLFDFNDHECRDFSARNDRDGYPAALDGLSTGLRDRREALLKSMVETDVKGFSTSRPDFIADTWWIFGLMLVLAIALAYAKLALPRGP